jgi:hypothetical protein
VGVMIAQYLKVKGSRLKYGMPYEVRKRHKTTGKMLKMILFLGEPKNLVTGKNILSLCKRES